MIDSDQLVKDRRACGADSITMTRCQLVLTRLLSLTVLLGLCACGSPTSPDGGNSGVQSLLDRATPDSKDNGVAVQPGSTANAAVGAVVSYQVNYTNNSGRILHYGILLVRDDGVERLEVCGATGSGGGGGGFGSSATIFSSDPIYTRGRTVRVLLLGALGPDVTGPGPCYLQSSPGQRNRANVQAERLLVVIAVQ
jgi:hypothetical protein